jgi:glutaminase
MEVEAELIGVEAPSPRRSAVAAYLERLVARHPHASEGSVASYIPELSLVDPSLFGVCLATVDGAVYQAGDTRVAFTIQSMSKPLTYGVALERFGVDAVRSRVGVEPSGDAFNEISLDPETGAPLNPLINAGAIACAGLIADSADDPLALLLDVYSGYAGRPLEIDEAVYRSEHATGHRNRAIAHMLRNFDIVAEDPDAAVDLYFRQCSVSVDCRDLAVIAATLANGGLNPITGERAVREDVVRDVLSVMSSCGMYDFAGEWLVSVGLPAKSGVSGGVLAVLPGRLGIGGFSPPLDARGNSVRGIAVCRDLSHDLGLHLVRPGERPASPVRASYTLAERRSKRVRTEADRLAIRAAAARTLVVELQGELGFSASEALARSVEEPVHPPDLVVVDLRRVLRAYPAGVRLLAELAGQLEVRGGLVVIASGPGGGETGDLAELQESCLVFSDLDLALEWCEDELLRRAGREPPVTAVALADHELMVGLSAAELERLDADLGSVTAAPGTILVRRDEPASDVFLVTHGMLSVVQGDGSDHRLTTLSAGMTFGELAFVDRGVRAADVRADSEVQCRTLEYATIDALATGDPVLYGKLLRNLLRVVVGTLHVVNTEVEHLAR